MILKRYVVNNMQEVMEKARMWRRSDYFNTKPVRKKVKGLFKAKIEVLVAYDEVIKDLISISSYKTEANYELKSKQKEALIKMMKYQLKEQNF